jgi:multiple sugar transport system substrate-binding protein
MLFGIVVACADDTPAGPVDSVVEPTPAAETPAAEPAAEAPAAEAPATERVQMYYTHWGGEEEMMDVQATLDIFNGIQDRMTITGLHIPNETYAEVLLTMAADDNMPDVGFALEATIIGWARDGLLKAIDIYEGQPEQPLEYILFTYEGQKLTSSNGVVNLALWFNKDLFDDAGIEYPPYRYDDAWTWDEFVEVAKSLTFDRNGNTPNDAGFNPNDIVQYGGAANTWTWQLEVFALSNGGRFFSEDGRSIVFDDAAIEAIQMVADLHLVHHVAPLNPGVEDSGFGLSVGRGDVAMGTDGHWVQGFVQETGINATVGVLPFHKQKVNIHTGGASVMWGGTHHPEYAAEFLRWYADPNLNRGGIEAGWVMPPLQSWFTDPDILRSWVDDCPQRQFLGIDRYKGVFIENALNFDMMKPTCWHYTPNTDIIYNILRPALSEVWTGAVTAKEAVESVRAAMEAALAG